jgi:hypothetical protein
MFFCFLIYQSLVKYKTVSHYIEENECQPKNAECQPVAAESQPVNA